MISPRIIYEDCQVLVIDKPSGIVVNRAETVREETIQAWIEQKLKMKKFATQSSSKPEKLKVYKEGEFCSRSGVVHRLDKGTSGLLVIAKIPKAYESLKCQFKKRQVKKKYVALVHGIMEAREGEIALPIKRLTWAREKFGIVPDGKKARTRYKVVTRYMLNATHYSLLEIEPETGRTHQIRVHLKYLGHPVVGDLKYGGRRAKKDRCWCSRLFLHAAYLSFHHPDTSKEMEFKTPLPKDLEKILSGLRKAS